MSIIEEGLGNRSIQDRCRGWARYFASRRMKGDDMVKTLREAADYIDELEARLEHVTDPNRRDLPA